MYVWPTGPVTTTTEAFIGFFSFEAILIGIPILLATVVYFGYFKKMFARNLKENHLE